jgi:hypothetical protein
MSTWGTEPSQNPSAGSSAENNPTPPNYGAPQANPANQPNPSYPPNPGQPPYGYPQPTQAQPQQPYPTQPYGAPQPPYGQPQQPYGQPYGAPQPYGQPYGTPQPYPQQPVAVKKNPLLGRIALALVVTTAAVATYTMGPMVAVINQMIIATGSTDLDSDALAEALMSSAAGPAAAFQLASFVGTAAMITGLVAAIIGRGRASGIFAFILGLLAPVIYITYAVILMLPAMQLIR